MFPRPFLRDDRELLAISWAPARRFAAAQQALAADLSTQAERHGVSDSSLGSLRRFTKQSECSAVAPREQRTCASSARLGPKCLILFCRSAAMPY